MKITKALFIAAAALIATSGSFAQETMRNKKAKRAFDEYSYADAIEKLTPVTEKSPDQLRMLAMSYYYNDDFVAAEPWFQKLMETDKATADDHFNFAQALKSNGKYDAYIEELKIFEKERSGDPRVKQVLADPNYYSNLLIDNGEFKIANLDINTAGDEFGPFFIDEQVAFASDRESTKPIKNRYNWNDRAFLNIYLSDEGEGGDLSNVDLMSSDVNTKYHEATGAMLRDSVTLYFTRNNYIDKKTNLSSEGVNNLQLYYAKKGEESFENATGVAFNSTEYSVGHPSLSADGKTMYFASDMPGGVGGVDIWRAPVNEDGTLGTPENLGNKVNTEGDEMFPFMASNGDMYIASDGHPGLGGFDLFRSSNRSSKPINLGVPLNSKADDFGILIKDDMKFGWFSSNRAEGKGNDDIYSIEFLTKTYALNGVVKNASTGEPMADLDVEITTKSGETKTLKTDENGEWNMEATLGEAYTMKASKKDFSTVLETVSVDDPNQSIYESELRLKEQQGLMLTGSVKEKGSGSPLDGVTVNMMDVSQRKTDKSYETDDTGVFGEPVEGIEPGDKLEYLITLKKPGYLSVSVPWDTTVASYETIDITNFLEKAVGDMVKLEIGADLGELLDIDPIYFDLDKSFIRPDAEIELKKIIKVMTDNPNLEIEFGSHTDCRASYAYNVALSDRRAKSTAKYVREQIENPKRIYGKGYGETQLVNKCACEGEQEVTCTEEEHQLNRRSVFSIKKF